MIILPRGRRPPTGRERTIGIGLGISAATVAILSNVINSGWHRLGDVSSLTTMVIFGGVAALPVIALAITKMIRRGNDDETQNDSMNGGNPMNSSSNADEMHDEDERAQKRIRLIAIASALAAIGLGAAVLASKAHAQTPGDRGAFIVLNGSDTVIVDRFVRTADTLRGSVSMKNLPRVEYTAGLGPANTVRTLLVRVMKPGAAAGETPLQEVFTAMQGDSAIISMGANTIRVGTTAGAVPSIANAFALFEPFTRRARLTGGTGDYAYFAMAGAKTLPLTVRPLGTDSLIVTIGGQAQHLRVDDVGRILGGSIIGQPAVIKRVDERDAAKITLGTTAPKAAEKPDYSAPRGAPYTAEEVSFKGPGGITLGGTLTKPTGAHGPVAAVVTITGSGQQDRDEYIPLAGGIRLFRQVADTLSRVGIAVLRLDDRGLGASTGNFSTSTTADFADDIRAALAYLRSRPDIDHDRLALIGHSEGGMIAPMVAATDPKLRAIAIMAGPADKMVDVIMSQNKWVTDHNPGLSAAQRDSVLAETRSMLAPERQLSSAIKFWMSYDPAPAAKKVKASTLILQGETDRQVPVANADKLAALIRSGGNKDVMVRLFPATDHLFLDDPTGDFLDMYKHVKTNRVSPEILGTLADWLVLKLGGPAVVK